MNEDQHGEGQGGPGRRGSEPFIIGISEGVNAGYKALEYVLEGLRESMRLRRTGRAGMLPSNARQQQRGGGGRPLDLDQVVGMVGDLLGSASDVAQEVARTVGERTAKGGHHEPHHDRLTIEVPQGGKSSTDFCVHNTSMTVLTNVKLTATSLVADGESFADVVDFEPRTIAKIAPGRWEMPKVTVDVPARAEPGTYRALLQGEPGGAWSMLEVVVTPKKPKGAREPDEAEEHEEPEAEEHE
jgi:hypothetical protein